LLPYPPIAIKQPPPPLIADKIQICGGGVASVQLHIKITLNKQRKIVRPLGTIQNNIMRGGGSRKSMTQANFLLKCTYGKGDFLYDIIFERPPSRK